MNVEHGQEEVVDFTAGHRGLRDHGNFPLDPGIDHKAVSRDIRNLVHQRPNIGILEV